MTFKYVYMHSTSITDALVISRVFVEMIVLFLNCVNDVKCNVDLFVIPCTTW